MPFGVLQEGYNLASKLNSLLPVDTDILPDVEAHVTLLWKSCINTDTNLSTVSGSRWLVYMLGSAQLSVSCNYLCSREAIDDGFFLEISESFRPDRRSLHDGSFLLLGIRSVHPDIPKLAVLCQLGGIRNGPQTLPKFLGEQKFISLNFWISWPRPSALS